MFEKQYYIKIKEGTFDENTKPSIGFQFIIKKLVVDNTIFRV